MRTTINLNLDDELLAEVKRVAARSGRSMTSVIEDALHAMLSQKRNIAERPSVYLTTVSGSGLQPGVDLDKSASLVALMDEDNDST